MTTRPSTALIRAAVAAAVLAAALLAAPAPAHAAPPPDRVLVCASGVCLLDPSGIDSDGDGFSDADEIAAGTDPHDPASHPQILQLLDGWFDHGIRPEGFALREVIVLPTTAPDGSALTGDLFAFGPQRGDALTRLGLTNPMLAGLSIDNGLRAVVDLGAGTTSGGPSVRVGGIDVSLISTIFNIDSHDMTISKWTDPDGTRHWQSTSVEVDYRDVNGDVEKETAVTTLSKAIGGSGTTSTMDRTTTVKKPDGTTTTTSDKTTVTTVDDKNKTTVNVSSTTDAKGARKVTTTTTTMVDGKKTTTTTTTTYDADGNEVGEPTTTCTGDDCPADYQSGEVDAAPMFAPGSTVVATPELTRRIEIYFNKHTNWGETPVEVDTTEPPEYSPLNPGLIYIDPSNDAVWWTPELTLPDPDQFGGNITFVPGFAPGSSHCLPTQKLPCPS